ncbi:MAG TPA: hypothetical protein VIY29_00810 [Ktedonobacteraceae bacterium]
MTAWSRMPRHHYLKAFRFLSPLMVIPATPHHPRPYGSIGLLSVSIASVDAYWAQ